MLGSRWRCTSPKQRAWRASVTARRCSLCGLLFGAIGRAGGGLGGGRDGHSATIATRGGLRVSSDGSSPPLTSSAHLGGSPSSTFLRAIPDQFEVERAAAMREINRAEGQGKAFSFSSAVCRQQSPRLAWCHPSPPTTPRLTPWSASASIVPGASARRARSRGAPRALSAASAASLATHERTARPRLAPSRRCRSTSEYTGRSARCSKRSAQRPRIQRPQGVSR